MKRIYLTLIGLLVVGSLAAQQLPLPNNHLYNAMPLNPAYAGYNNHADFLFEYAFTGQQLEGSPQMFQATANIPVHHKNIGWGATISNDQIGVQSTTALKGNLAYKIKTESGSSYSKWGYFPRTLSFGLSVGYKHVKEDFTALNMPNDPNFQTNTEWAEMVVGAGALLSDEHYFIGISAPDLTVLVTDVAGETNPSVPHLFANGGYAAALKNGMWLKPNAIVSYAQGAPLSLDVNVLLALQKKIDIGLGYRTSNTIYLNTALYLNKNWRLLYQFNYGLEDTSGINSFQHIGLNYRIKKGF